MSAKKEDLYNLIQSLSKTEKRYFKMEARKAGDKSNSKYLQLFEAIHKMDKYDEERLKSKDFVKNLSMEKAYLTDAILRSLRNFHSEKSLAARMRDLVTNARLLQDRELYDQSLRQLGKAKKLAFELQDHLSVLEINKMESSFLLRKRDRGNAEALAKLQQERERLMTIISEEVEYLGLYHNLSGLLHKGHTVSGKEISEQIQQLIGPVLDVEAASISSFHARIRFLQSLTISKALTGQAEEAYQYNRSVVDEYDKYTKILREDTFRYIISLHNLIQKCLQQKKYAEIPELLRKLKDTTQLTKSNELLVFNLEVPSRLIFYMNTKQFDKAGELASIVDEGLKKYNLTPRRRIVFHHNVAIFFLINQQLDEAKQWFNKTIGLKKNDARQDLQRIARIFYLLIQYETSDLHDDMENSIRSVQRYFRLHTNLDNESYESQLLNYIRKTYYVSPDERKKVLQEFKSYLAEQVSLKKAGLEELSLWVESKITGNPIIELLD